MSEKVYILNREDMLIVIRALRYQAIDEAGQSQAPNLFAAEDTVEWQLAETLAHALYQES